jgi:molybdopterin molybdotransferase
MTNKPITDLLRDAGCMDDYDPNSMPVAHARTYIRDYLTPVTATESVPLRGSLGRILAQDIQSPCNVPNHDNSAMDGYAFNVEDSAPEGMTSLRIAGTAFAGNPFAAGIGKGECVRIMTGAVLPQGANAVVVQERVSVQGDYIAFSGGLKSGANIRYAGEDLKLGQTVLASGHMMRPAELGLIASLGLAEIKVFRRLKVAFFSTGNELTSIGQELESGQVYDSNRYTLYGMLMRLGVEIIDMGVIRDDPVLLERALLKASANADVILTSGGVSVGEADYMKQLLEKLGQVVFWKIAMKPGRPLAYGKVGNAHYFGLPGNPVSVMVTFYQFVREALLVLMGQPNPPPSPLLNATCTAPIKKNTGRTEFQRGILSADQNGVWQVAPTGAQGSGILRSMSEANCFIVLDESVGDVPAGATVQVQILEGIV